MKSNKEFIGEKFNDWTVIDWIQGNKGIEWVCRCKCGEIKTHKVDNIKNGRSKMCKKCYSLFRKEEAEKKVYENIGKKNGLLTIKEIYKKNEELYCICRCECGNIYENKFKYIRAGDVKSCGCLLHKVRNEFKNERLFKVWTSMRNRCYNKKAENYKNYGLRGIKICEEWKNDYLTFRKWAYENGYNNKAKRGECTIDRIDVNGNYEPSNCRWVDMKIQAKNKRQGILGKKYKIYGKEMTVKEIEKEYGITKNALYFRIRKGLTNESMLKK